MIFKTFIQKYGEVLKNVLPKEVYHVIRNRYLIMSNCPTALSPLESFSPDYAALSKSELDQNSELKSFIYVISPTQRSGTNYLHAILSLHPKLYTPKSDNYPSESFLFYHSDLLVNYCYETFRIWKHWYRGDERLFEQNYKSFLKKMGDGILSFFLDSVPSDKILLLRTPDSHNIKYFPHLFPGGKMVILMRDGRDTVQSFIDSWGGEPIFKQFTKRWKNRKEQIDDYLNIMKINDIKDRSILINYEDLLREPVVEVEKLLRFLELDIEQFNWEKLKNLPVLGSSKSKKAGGPVNWKPIAKGKNFEPSEKWKKWSNRKKKTFYKIVSSDNITSS